MANKYMHLIDGRPGYFAQSMIWHCRDGVLIEEILVDSLKEIRKQQAASNEHRFLLGLQMSSYSYLRVKVS